MTALVLGGSSGLGRALCEELARRGHDVVIAASGLEDCERLASHIGLVHSVKAWPLAVDARDPAAFRAGLTRGLGATGQISEVYLPIGLARDHDRVGEADCTLEDLFRVNYAAVVTAVELAQPHMPEDGGRIVGFGSIAAIRARNRNVQYAAAKSALATYFEALRHALARTNRTAQFYIVGYVDSGQSFGKTQLFPPISARSAARQVLDDGERDFGRRYLPRYWALVGAILRWLPWRVFARLGF